MPNTRKFRWTVEKVRDEWFKATDRKRQIRAYSVITVDGSHSDVNLAFA